MIGAVSLTQREATTYKYIRVEETPPIGCHIRSRGGAGVGKCRPLARWGSRAREQKIRHSVSSGVATYAYVPHSSTAPAPPRGVEALQWAGRCCNCPDRKDHRSGKLRLLARRRSQRTARRTTYAAARVAWDGIHGWRGGRTGRTRSPERLAGAHP